MPSLIGSRVLIAVIIALCAAWLPVQKSTLYDDLGGKAGVDAIVDDVLHIFADDSRVGPFFANSNIPRFRRLFVQYLCGTSEGGCEYEGNDMQESHTGLGITDKSFNEVVEDLQQAMVRIRIPVRTQNRLLARLAPQHKDIVDR